MPTKCPTLIPWSKSGPAFFLVQEATIASNNNSEKNALSIFMELFEAMAQKTHRLFSAHYRRQAYRSTRTSGFANTDLDLQLKKHGIHQLIVTGLIAHTCVDATVRYAAEPDYEVTMVKGATGGLL